MKQVEKLTFDKIKNTNQEPEKKIMDKNITTR